MMHIPWTLYALRLQRVAEKLSEARDDADVARCLQEHTVLWQRISDLISEAEGDGMHGLRRQMSPLSSLMSPRRRTEAVADGDLSAEAVSSLIALNRQAAALLPVLERGTPMKQWLN